VGHDEPESRGEARTVRRASRSPSARTARRWPSPTRTRSCGSGTSPAGRNCLREADERPATPRLRTRRQDARGGDPDGFVGVWDVASAAAFPPEDRAGLGWGLAFVGDSKTLASGMEKGWVGMWGLETKSCRGSWCRRRSHTQPARVAGRLAAGVHHRGRQGQV
jgi:hypothetical protein